MVITGFSFQYQCQTKNINLNLCKNLALRYKNVKHLLNNKIISIYFYYTLLHKSYLLFLFILLVLKLAFLDIVKRAKKIHVENFLHGSKYTG